MLTPLTVNIDVWIFICTALIGVGGYILITKQNSLNIKNLGNKVDTIGGKVEDIKSEMKIEQVRIIEKLNGIHEKANRIEGDTASLRAQGGMLGESIARIEVRVETLEREHRKNESN